MLSRYAGRLAFISGGASGIGLGIAEAFCDRGLSVALADIDIERAKAEANRLSSNGARAIALSLDVRNPVQWEQALSLAEATFGPIAILCSNAGVAGSVLPITDCSLSGWEWSIKVNLDGCFLAMKTGVPRLLAHGLPAHFLATASMAPFVTVPGNGPYSAAKAGVVALCETLNLELRSSLVGVSVMCPGLVKTRLLSNNHALSPRGVEIGKHSDDLVGMIDSAMSPRSVGEIVVHGIEENRFWLFTSPQSGDRIRAHNGQIEAALRADLKPGID